MSEWLLRRLTALSAAGRPGAGGLLRRRRDGQLLGGAAHPAAEAARGARQPHRPRQEDDLQGHDEHVPQVGYSRRHAVGLGDGDAGRTEMTDEHASTALAVGDEKKRVLLVIQYLKCQAIPRLHLAVMI